MNEKTLKDLVRGIRQGKVSEAEAMKVLKKLPFADLGHTKVDHHRALRQGMGEVIFAPGKTAADIISILKEMTASQSEALVTRVSEEQARAVKKAFPRARHNRRGRTLRVPGARPGVRRGAGRGAGALTRASSGGPVAVVSGGTADSPVVEEIRETLLWLGLRPVVITDVGVAGIHRLLAHHEEIERARVIIVVAGMEGALASVVGGLVDKPVIGVPVSVGYGAGAGGIAALLGMLNSCASGVMVTNIDNGFGAACAAARILRAAGER
ncbi:MAG TPA: nickel pincer cofactor biosynthesis protein LarB [bacterium]|nr:nickel pincer cofactor biosynthesis protein LarB [bacterium]